MNSWDKLYTTEIANNAANPDDIGTVWFDDSDAEDKMLDFLARLAGDIPDASSSCSSPLSEDENVQTLPPPDPSSSATRGLSFETTSILDLGCGNGSILFSLRARGWRGPLTGVDYSAHSIRLAKQVAASRNLLSDISFAEWDLLRGPALSTVLAPPSSVTTTTTTTTTTKSSTTTGGTFDVVLDKGTFDAISLSDATDDRGRRVCEGYKARVLPLLPVNGLFLITSCNWTEAELRDWFVGGEIVDGAAFEEAGRVKYRTFSFGGVSGQTISTLCFRKIATSAPSSA
ncbi:hypothetical protein V2A60_009056 [Cordyceps javanica]